MSVTARQCFQWRRTHCKEDVFDVCVTFARPSRGFVSIFLSIVRVGPSDTRHTWHPVPGIPQPARLDHAGSCLSSLVEASVASPVRESRGWWLTIGRIVHSLEISLNDGRFSTGDYPRYRIKKPYPSTCSEECILIELELMVFKWRKKHVERKAIWDTSSLDFFTAFLTFFLFFSFFSLFC